MIRLKKIRYLIVTWRLKRWHQTGGILFQSSHCTEMFTISLCHLDAILYPNLATIPVRMLHWAKCAGWKKLLFTSMWLSKYYALACDYQITHVCTHPHACMELYSEKVCSHKNLCYKQLKLYMHLHMQKNKGKKNYEQKRVQGSSSPDYMLRWCVRWFKAVHLLKQISETSNLWEFKAVHLLITHYMNVYLQTW